MHQRFAQCWALSIAILVSGFCGRAGAEVPAVTEAPKPTYPTVQVNGVFQADAGWYRQDAASIQALGNLQDGVDFRRLRLSAKGSVIENVNYMIQMDFAFFGRPTFTDVWAEVTHVPLLGNIRLGQWKQPYGLEVVSSFRYQTFLERSLMFQAFDPFRHIGLGIYDVNASKRMTWAASAFRTGQDQFGGDIGDHGGWSGAARITGLPWWREAGTAADPQAGQHNEYLHLGAAYYHGNPGNDKYRFATIPEFYVGAFGALGATGTSGTSKVPVPAVANGTPPFVDTGTMPVHNVNNGATELLWVHGPLTLQSELQASYVNRIQAKNLWFFGGYAQASYFITGESRPYDRNVAAVDRVKPISNFVTRADGISGTGAWEVAARWSYLDLDDRDIRGGKLNDLTVGLNWYLNPYLKLQANYIRAMLQKTGIPNNTTNIYAVRTQLDF